MNKMKRYKVIYVQKFMGELHRDSYIREVNDENQLMNIKDALFDDPHVVSVYFEELTENE
jgi:hypothetical protein